MADELAEPVLEHLVEAWRSMPARQKLLLWHHAVLGETEDHLARRLGVTASSLPVLLERARLELGVRYREVAHRATLASTVGDGTRRDPVARRPAR